MKNLFKSLSFTLALTLSILSQTAMPASADSHPTQLKWLGHATFLLTTPQGAVLLIDPWLKNPMNPEAAGGKDPLAALKKVDYILVTHGHFDHMADAAAVAKKFKNAKLVTNFELGSAMGVAGFPKTQMGMDSLFNIGGQIDLASGEVTVAMTPAVHSSGVTVKEGAAPLYGGSAAGFVIKIKNGPTIYDTGDTAYFSDMKLIGEQYKPDLALVNIGGHFGMEPAQAVQATVDSKAKYAVPMHYKTFPILTQSADGWAKGVKDKSIQPVVMAPGETIEFSGGQLLNNKKQD